MCLVMPLSMQMFSPVIKAHLVEREEETPVRNIEWFFNTACKVL